MAAYHGAWRYRVSAWNGWSSGSLRCLGQRLIGYFCLSVAASEIFPRDQSPNCWDVKTPTNQPTKTKQQQQQKRNTPNKRSLYRSDRLVGLVVKASASRAEDPGFESSFRRDFSGRVIPVTSKLAIKWHLCQALGVIRSALELVGTVSVYCDWVRWQVGSATSVSVWQHVQLPEQNPSLRYTRMLLVC